jgi:DNA processing protein
MNEEELKYRLALHLVKGIGPVSARALISYCGSVENIFKKKKAQLERIPGIGKGRAAGIHRKDLFVRAEEEMNFLYKNEIRPLFCLDENYPSRLKNCEDAPLMLFYKGGANLNHDRMIAVVGTRYITPYGKAMTEKLIEELVRYRVVVVSGLAYGVDVQAHRSALKNGIPTVGVVAHGLDRLYPAENKSIADRMIREGGLVTEYPGRTKPDRENFPARNRIVAGMCDAVVVIESAEKGGALITADLANDYNREVFALPGRTTDVFSRGCHRLIMQNKAMLYESGDDIAAMMGWEDPGRGGKKKLPAQHELFSALNEEEQKLIHVLRETGKTGIDVLAQKAQLPVSRTSSVLLNLEFAGILRTLPGKCYELI